jgi:DNA-binding HxlR family transcriptional regulator
LIGGWGSTMLRALAARPLSLTELSSVIAELSYPSLERRLSAMRAARQVEARPNGGRGAKPYAVTDWTRQAVAPLVAAGRCECAYLAEVTEPLTRIDIEAAFLLSVPLVDLQVNRSGSCLLAVDTGTTQGGKPASRVAGVHVEVREGAVVSCVSRLQQQPSTWALGTVEGWVDAILNGSQGQLRLGGKDPELARSTIAGLHAAL